MFWVTGACVSMYGVYMCVLYVCVCWVSHLYTRVLCGLGVNVRMLLLAQGWPQPCFSKAGAESEVLKTMTAQYRCFLKPCRWEHLSHTCLVLQWSLGGYQFPPPPVRLQTQLKQRFPWAWGWDVRILLLWIRSENSSSRYRLFMVRWPHFKPCQPCAMETQNLSILFIYTNIGVALHQALTISQASNRISAAAAWHSWFQSSMQCDHRSWILWIWIFHANMS